MHGLTRWSRVASDLLTDFTLAIILNHRKIGRASSLPIFLKLLPNKGEFIAVFMTKKKKIRLYLEQKSEEEYSAFDCLMAEYLDDTLKRTLVSAGMCRIEIHVDWFEDIKCIGIQGQYAEYLADIHIYPEEFDIAFDKNEPDDDVTYPIESKQQFYDILFETMRTLS